MRQTLLLVDDKADMLTMLTRLVQAELEVEVLCVASGAEALALLKERDVDVVMSDIRMPGMDGLELLQQIRARDGDAVVIMMTAYGSIDSAVESLKRGAYDFITKPFDEERMLHVLKKALEHKALKRQARDLERRIREKEVGERLVGQSTAMRGLIEKIRLVAATEVPVLITGETGTGKELAATMLHELSARSDGPLVVVNCAAIPEDILESELFGHHKGAFTGALSARAGLFAAAEGGTLVLDEIGDMPLLLQAKLLRVLQEKRIRPLGADRGRAVDVRILAATNQNLPERIMGGQFREDLYHRLACVALHTPALREITDDIPLLARHFLGLYNVEFGLDKKMAEESMHYLLTRKWPGNVRELQNAIKRALIFSRGDTVQPEDFDCSLALIPESGEMSMDLCGQRYREAKEKLVEKFSIRYLNALLAESGGNVSRAAKQAGMERQSLQQLLKKYGVSAERFRSR